MASAAPLRVLVTGGSGYLGAALLRHLYASHPGWELHATCLSHSISATPVFSHLLDLTDANSVGPLLRQIQPWLIVHTAALVAGSAPDLYRVNAQGTAAVASGARSLGARLLHLSTDMVFDGEKGNYAEEDAPRPILAYGESKWQAEKAVMASGAEAVVVRTSLIYGFRPVDPRTHAVLSGQMSRLFVDEMRCPIWIHDLCAALTELAELDYRGILHVAGPQPVSRYELGRKLAHRFGGDEDRLIPALSAESGLVRPHDCTLNISRARQLLKTPLTSLDEVLRTALNSVD